MNLKRIRVLLLILTLTLGIVSCKSDSKLNSNNQNNNKNSNQSAKVNGGEIDIPLINVQALNPLLNNSSSVYYFNKLIFEGLFEFDKNLEPKEQLVDKYKVNADGSIDISLKKNIEWHDGKTLDTSDIKFTIDAIKYGLSNKKYSESISDMYKPGGMFDIENIFEIDIKNNYNMTINFKEENTGNILERLTFPIIPKHLFNEEYDKALQTENYKPIGTGPYKQIQYEKLKFIKLESNAKYWGEKPHIKNIRGRILKDESLSLTSFESGQLDLAFSLESDWEKYSQDEQVRVSEFPSRKYEFLAVNSESEIFQGEVGKAVRQAIAYGINKEEIIKKVYLGHATKVNTPLNPSSYLSNKDLNSKYSYNVKKARDILEAVGFIDSDNDTMYEDEKGNPISIKLSTNSYNPLRVKTLKMIGEDLKSIGITTEQDYEVIENQVLDEEARQDEWEKFEYKINSSAFDIALLGWETSLLEDMSFMFHSSEKIGTNNFINYENPALDTELDDIKNSLNKKDRKDIYSRAQEIILEDLPYISLFYTHGAILSNKKISGGIDPNYANIYTNIDEWFIPEKYQSDAQ